MSVGGHRAYGYVLGLGMRLLSSHHAARRIRQLDLWAWDREWKQNQAGENPNDPMSPHQVAEAKAWGEGARLARRVNPPFPVPPYPAGT